MDIKVSLIVINGTKLYFQKQRRIYRNDEYISVTVEHIIKRIQ